jgi:hypothetical protein
MSRSGYHDDLDVLDLGRWRGQVASAIRGKRGQVFFRELVAALDAMPEKRLIQGALEEEAGVCAIGALCRAKGIHMETIDPSEPSEVAPLFDIAECLAREVVYMNDEFFDTRLTEDRKGYRDYTPEELWQAMRDWAAKKIRAAVNGSELPKVTK